MTPVTAVCPCPGQRRSIVRTTVRHPAFPLRATLPSGRGGTYQPRGAVGAPMRSHPSAASSTVGRRSTGCTNQAAIAAGVLTPTQLQGGPCGPHPPSCPSTPATRLGRAVREVRHTAAGRRTGHPAGSPPRVAHPPPRGLRHPAGPFAAPLRPPDRASPRRRAGGRPRPVRAVPGVPGEPRPPRARPPTVPGRPHPQPAGLRAAGTTQQGPDSEESGPCSTRCGPDGI